MVHTQHLSSTEVTIGRAEAHGDLLPIDDDDNFCQAASSANPLLRVFVQKREEADHHSFGAGTLSRKKKALVTLGEEGLRRRAHLDLSLPHDFRPGSSIIDVDFLPRRTAA